MGSRVKLRLGFLSILEQVVMLTMILFMTVDMLSMANMPMMIGDREQMEMMDMDHTNMNM